MYKLLERARSFLREIYFNQDQSWSFLDTYQANLVGRGEDFDIWERYVRSPLEKALNEVDLEEDEPKRT